MAELTLDDLYRLEKDGIGRDVTDKELFGLIALAREALRAREVEVYALALSCTKLYDKYTTASYANMAASLEEAVGQGIAFAKEIWPIDVGYVNHGCSARKILSERGPK